MKDINNLKNSKAYVAALSAKCKEQAKTIKEINKNLRTLYKLLDKAELRIKELEQKGN